MCKCLQYNKFILCECTGVGTSSLCSSSNIDNWKYSTCSIGNDVITIFWGLWGPNMLKFWEPEVLEILTLIFGALFSHDIGIWKQLARCLAVLLSGVKKFISGRRWYSLLFGTFPLTSLIKFNCMPYYSVACYHWFIRVVATVEDMNRRNSVLVVRSSLLAKWLWERIWLGLRLYPCDQFHGN